MPRLLLPAVIVCGSLAWSFNASAAGPAADRSDVRRIESAVKSLTDAQARVLGRASAFCAASRPADVGAPDAGLGAYLTAFSDGTKAAMEELVRSDRRVLDAAPSFREADFQMMDKQAAALLAKVEGSADVECARLSAFLQAATAETFRASTLQGHQDFKARRAAYCAQSPKPKTCP